MKTLFFYILLCFAVFRMSAQETKKLVYLIPGQGSDARLFKNIQLDSIFEVRNIEYFTPEKEWNMREFAKQLSTQIDTTRDYSIIGVSLGGMLATEMADFLHPEKVIVISSAKDRREFPFRYRIQKIIPIYKLVPAGVVKLGGRILQPIVEPDRRRDAATFKSMLRSKDPKFLKRTVKMILEWDRIDYKHDIIHIHGDLDKTIPARNVAFDYLVEDGSHMMALTRADLISEILNGILLDSAE